MHCAVCLCILLHTRGIFDRSVFYISPKQTLRGPLELCSCKVSSVLCQIMGLSLHLCQFQIKTRSPIHTFTKANWPMRTGNATPQLTEQERRRTELIRHGLSFLYLLLSGVSYSISPGSYYVTYVQQLMRVT